MERPTRFPSGKRMKNDDANVCQPKKRNVQPQSETDAFCILQANIDKMWEINIALATSHDPRLDLSKHLHYLLKNPLQIGDGHQKIVRSLLKTIK
jgi:hypothetical protein